MKLQVCQSWRVCMYQQARMYEAQGCGVGVGAGVGVSRSRLFCSESESESTKFTDSDRLRASPYSRFKEIAMQII